MATRVYLTSPGVPAESTVEGVGAAVQSSFLVSVTVDLTTTGLDATTRQIRLAEVIQQLENVKGYILLKNLWPPV